MLNRAIGGAFGFGTDIGGYFDIGPYPPTSKELFLRWAEWAALTPVFRLHGSVSAGVHAPWTYDQQTVDVYNALSGLHLSAEPLIRRLWREADRDGVPPTEPLYLAFPSDARAAQEDQEWLLGPDVLVAPVVMQGATSRSVYFPSGCWSSSATGQVVRGPRALAVPAALGDLPFYFRCGSRPFARPVGSERRYACAGRAHRNREGRRSRDDSGTAIARYGTAGMRRLLAWPRALPAPTISRGRSTRSTDGPAAGAPDFGTGGGAPTAIRISGSTRLASRT